MSLSEIRKAAGFKTGKQFAEAIGIPPSSYARFEQPSNGAHIPMERALLIADKLGCSIDEVVGRDWMFERPAGPQQERYDALGHLGKAMLDSYLDYLEHMERERGERR